jgi:hypothetical protein
MKSIFFRANPLRCIRVKLCYFCVKPFIEFNYYLTDDMIKKLTKWILIISFFIPGFNAYPQEDQASLLLDLKKARATYEISRQKYENDRKLLENDAISEDEFNNSKNEFLSAEVEYQKLILKLISRQSYIIVEKAIKYQDQSGRRRVKITLLSTMEGNQDYLNQFEEHFDVFTPEMRSGKTYNVFVSLINLEDQTIIGTPYEIRVPAIDLGQSVNVDFGLLRDVESLQVLLNYNNRTDEKNIFLEKDASTSFVDITSTQFSQEADLGSSTTYDLSLERFTATDDIYKLLVVNLPRQISSDFLDGSTGARLSQLKFNQGENIRKLSLKTYLPERGDEDVVIDQPIVFYALAVTAEHYNKLEEKLPDKFTEEELADIRGGKIRLELIPRGVGKLEVRATNLYHEITEGDTINMNITVRNYGTRIVDNIRIRTDNPLNWNSSVEPGLIPSLAPEEETRVTITILPPVDVNVGAQEIRIRTEAYAHNRRVETEDKTVRIQVNAKTSLGWTLLLIVLLIGLVVGIVIFGIKISRR